MSQGNAERQPVMDEYEHLEFLIVEYEKGRIERAEVYVQWQKYRAACRVAGEGAFCLDDILHDDLPNLPLGYPSSGAAAFEVTGGGIYRTDIWQAKKQSLLEKYGGEI